MKRGFLLGLALALALCGCAHFQPQPLSPAQTAAALDSRRLDDPGLQQFLRQNLGRPAAPGPIVRWNLPALTLVAFYYHPALEVARQQWLTASAALKTAGGRPNPSVSVAPGYDSQIPGNYSPWLVPATFDVPLETAGKRAKRLAEAAHLAEAARWQLVSAAWQIRSDVRASLLDYLITQRRAACLQMACNLQTALTQRMQQQCAAGENSPVELTLAQIAWQRTRMDLNDAQAAHVAARSRLAEALGLSLRALDGARLTLEDPATNAAALSSQTARAIALRSRPDILAALASYAAAEDDVRLEIAKQYPDLHLGPGYAWNNGNAGDNQWSLGLTLELPLLNQNQGPIAEAEARRRLAAAIFLQQQAQVVGEIDRAVADYDAAQVQVRAGQAMLAAEARQEHAAAERLRAGAGSQLDLLNARLEANSAALTQLDSEARLQTAAGELEAAVQSPLNLSPASLAAAEQGAATAQKPHAPNSHDPNP